jgi:hypothetical protein
LIRAPFNGDGTGDLRGIRARLGNELGIDAVWISPIFPSPMADFGYDIADYTGIAPIFGTIEDFDALMADLKPQATRHEVDIGLRAESHLGRASLVSGVKIQQRQRQTRLVPVERSGAKRRGAE